MQECCRTEQTCLFIHYPVSDRHTIICVFELVILFLITLANKGKKQCFLNDRIAKANRIQSISHTTCIHVLTFYSLTRILINPMDDSRINGRIEQNRVAGSVLGP